MYRIYLVEDDQVIAGAIADKLGAWGFTVKCAEDFSNIMGEFAAFQPHLVLLDITLPFLTAITGARRSGGSPGSPFYSCPPPGKISTLLWPSTWGPTISFQAL